MQGVLGQDVENIGDYWRDFELPDWAKHIYFFFLMVLPLWLWYLYKRKPKREKWLNDYVMNWSNTFWRIVLSYSLILVRYNGGSRMKELLQTIEYTSRQR